MQRCALSVPKTFNNLENTDGQSNGSEAKHKERGDQSPLHSNESRPVHIHRSAAGGRLQENAQSFPHLGGARCTADRAPQYPNRDRCKRADCLIPFFSLAPRMSHPAWYNCRMLPFLTLHRFSLVTIPPSGFANDSMAKKDTSGLELVRRSLAIARTSSLSPSAKIRLQPTPQCSRATKRTIN